MYFSETVRIRLKNINISTLIIRNMTTTNLIYKKKYLLFDQTEVQKENTTMEGGNLYCTNQYQRATSVCEDI